MSYFYNALEEIEFIKNQVEEQVPQPTHANTLLKEYFYRKCRTKFSKGIFNY